MKFICLGYADESKWDALPEEDRKSFMDECFAYDDELRRKGHCLGGEVLARVRDGVTVRFRSGQVDVTDGPYAETKEQLGGILLLEARDLNHAISLISNHPGLRFGPLEIRPEDKEINRLAATRHEGPSTQL